ncbi:MAG TPA: hypothetical protein DCE41_33360 [Cytophagales bacterium]|nr:hypothetical protein [Cytophagales bacterium]
MGEPQIQADRTDYSVEEYHAMQERSTLRLEYFNGVIRAMSGGNRNHARILTNTLVGMSNKLAGSDCEVYGEQLKILSPKEPSYLFPDVMAVCGPETLEPGRDDVLTNPTLIIEVLSPSTMHYDFVKKYDRYKQIPSLQEYVLISQDQPRIELRSSQDDWGHIQVVKGMNASVTFASVGITLPLEEIYRQVKFE